MKKGIFKKGMAFLACFALVLTTMVSNLSMLVNAEEGPTTITINVETSNCTLYYRLNSYGDVTPSSKGSWTEATTSISFDSNVKNQLEIKIMADDGYTVSSCKLGGADVGLGGDAKIEYVESLDLSALGDGQFVDLPKLEGSDKIQPGTYTLKLGAATAPPAGDPPAGDPPAGEKVRGPEGVEVNVTKGLDWLAYLTVSDNYEDGKTKLYYQLEFGKAVSAVTVNGTTYSGDDIVKTSDKDEFKISIPVADSYTISFAEGESDNVTIVWSYDRASAISKYGNDDAYVEHGKVELVSVRRDGDIIFDDKHPNESFKNAIRADGGDVFLKRNDNVVLRLIPDYGYQLKSASLNGEKLEAIDDEVSTFEIERIQGNLHFAGAFVKAEDKTDVKSDLVTKASIANGANAANSGNLSLSVKDDSSYNKDLTSVIGNSEVVSSLDLVLDNIVSKGDNTYWSNNITEFTSPIKLSLTLDQDLAAGEKITVVRDHNGTLTELPATYVNGVLSFESNQFSTYTVVKTKAKKVVFADMYSNAKVSVGKGTIAKITDAKVQLACETRSAEVDVIASKIETKSKVAEVIKTFAFDVQGIASGEVTLNIGIDNAGKMVIASHLGEATWENLGLSEVNEKGDVTIKSNSYSPIMLSVLNIKADDLADEAKADVRAVSYDPEQTVKVPDTGDNASYAWCLAMLLAGATLLVVGYKKRNRI